MTISWPVTKKSAAQRNALPYAVLTLISVLTANEALATVRLPKLVGDNMVLQRDTPLKIWGWADAGEQVTVDFHGHHGAAMANDKGEWLINLPAEHAGGSYSMKIVGTNTITLANILIGDVWLASGQSNMQFPLSGETGFGGVNNADAEVSAANFPQIRLFSVARVTALVPETDVQSAGWFETTPQTVKRFSAIAYLFGRELHKRYQVPIGLIDSTWGGTPAEAWMSDAAVQRFPEFHDVLQRKALIDVNAWTGYDTYLTTRSAWYARHNTEDRGCTNDHCVWSSADLDDSGWPVTTMPKAWPDKPLKGYDGTVWLRKHVTLDSTHAGKPVQLHLSHLVQSDTTYFNGHQAGSANAGDVSRNYTVPGEYVHAGDNVIVIHLKGDNHAGEGFVGMYVDPDDVFLRASDQTISLAGKWLIQSGPDLTELPDIPAIAEFRASYPQVPVVLFNSMIAPLDQFKIKGVIWYQGEANAGRPKQYRTLFPALIRNWREAWGYQFPFLFVQLAGFGADKTEPYNSDWAELREAQDMTLSVPHTGMATAVDIGDRDDIHPRNKQDVAHRLVLAARKVAYHEKLVYSGPRYQRMRVQDKQIRLQFSDSGSGLMVKGNELHGFAIAGKDGKFVWAKASLAGNEVIVSSDVIKAPHAVRYDWSNTPQGNLYNKEGLPALPFRTEIEQ